MAKRRRSHQYPACYPRFQTALILLIVLWKRLSLRLSVSQPRGDVAQFLAEHFLLCGTNIRQEGLMAIGLMWNYQVVELSGVPEQDEATLNPFGLIGYELVAVTPVAATGRPVAYLKRGTLPESEAEERA
jgi:hypothetical protein